MDRTDDMVEKNATLLRLSELTARMQVHQPERAAIEKERRNLLQLAEKRGWLLLDAHGEAHRDEKTGDMQDR